MYPVLLTIFPWLDSHQYLALWLEGIALLAIFIWDRWDSHQQHQETLKQMKIMESHAIAAKDAAEAAKANAEAARLNAQAVINSERPWIVVSARPHQSTAGSFVFTATNKGRTPAVFESGTFDLTFDSYPHTLPTLPQYACPFTPDRTLIGQDDGFDIPLNGVPSVNPESVIKTAEITKQVKIGSTFLLFYGKIIYKDVLNRDGKEAIRHETRWCYCFDVSSGQLVRSGPEEYNRYT